MVVPQYISFPSSFVIEFLILAGPKVAQLKETIPSFAYS